MLDIPADHGQRSGHLRPITVEGAVYSDECDRFLGWFDAMAGRIRGSRFDVSDHHEIPGLPDLSRRIGGLLHMANQTEYFFNVKNHVPALVLDIARPNSGQIEWHADYAILRGHDALQLKLVGSVQLSHSAECEGGSLQFTGEQTVVGSRERGDLIVYPSFMLHCRTAITRGTRLALLVGAYGPAFQ